MSHNPRLRKLEQESHEHQDAITAILGEHLPEEVMHAVQFHIDGMIGNAYSIADEMERYAYGILYTMIPDHVAELRATWTVALFPGSVADWREYEGGLPETMMTESRLLDKWKGTDEL